MSLLSDLGTKIGTELKALQSALTSKFDKTGGSISGPLDINVTGRAITITGDTMLDGADAGIYLGNTATSEGYGFDIEYKGIGSGNTNAFTITSTNLGNPKELIRANQDGIVNLPQLGATIAGNEIYHTGNLPTQSAAGLESGNYTLSDEIYINYTTAPTSGAQSFYGSLVLNKQYDGWNRLRFDKNGTAQWGIASNANDEFVISRLDASFNGTIDDTQFVINKAGDISTTGNLTLTATNATTALLQVGKSTDGTQGTGAIEVTQDGLHGGGIVYNGDATPAFVSGEGSDQISFYRNQAGARSVVFQYPYNSDTVTFNGTINVKGNIQQNGTNIGSSGKILKVTTFSQASEVALGQYSEKTVFGGSFTKVSSTSKIIATCTVYGNNFESGNCGVGMKMDTTWDFGVGYQYDGSWSDASQTQIVIGTSEFNGFAAGSHTMYFGWKSANGSTTERPFQYISPNSRSDARNNQFVSRIVVWEVEA